MREKPNKVKRSPFGERVYQARTGCGLSQIALAKQSGLSERQICRLERQDPPPSGAKLVTLAKALNTTAGYLLGETIQHESPATIDPMYHNHIETLRSLPMTKQREIIKMAQQWAATAS